MNVRQAAGPPDQQEPARRRGRLIKAFRVMAIVVTGIFAVVGVVATGYIALRGVPEKSDRCEKHQQAAAYYVEEWRKVKDTDQQASVRQARLREWVIAGAPDCFSPAEVATAREFLHNTNREPS